MLKDMFVEILLEVVERSTRRSIIAPVEWKTRLPAMMFGVKTEEMSDLELIDCTKRVYLYGGGEAHIHEISAQTGVSDWVLDAVLLNKRAESLRERYCRLGLNFD